MKFLATFFLLCPFLSASLLANSAAAESGPRKLELGFVQNTELNERVSLQLSCQQEYQQPPSNFNYGMTQILKEGDKIVQGKQWQFRNGSISLSHSLRFSVETPALRRSKAKLFFTVSYNKGAISLRI